MTAQQIAPPTTDARGIDERIFDQHRAAPHERVVFANDAASGLRAIIAIHSTVLGPALGGTRFYPYADEQAALTDVLRLSRGMTYKAAAAGLDLGGGKAVIVGDPTTLKSDELLKAYGRLVESLGGDYITAGDVGTTSADMDVIGATTSHVVARTAAAGGSGDSAPLTALGVFRSMQAAAASVWGTGDLSGRSVGVEGVGKVGRNLVELLVADGARVVVSDVSRTAVDAVRRAHPQVTAADRVIDLDLDVYAPCALGATLTPRTVATLTSAIVCGAANNQLSSAAVEHDLHARSITWVPDYVANSGGLIQVAGERLRQQPDVVRGQVDAVYDTVAGILEYAADHAITPGAAADHLASARLAARR
jgi:valine dehydrogenase (NAD+)